MPGLYSQSVRAEMKIGGKRYCVQAYLGDGQTAQAGNILRGDFRIRVTLPGGSKQNAVSFGRGIFAQLSTKGAIAIEAGQENRLRYLPQRLGARAKEAVEACFPEDTAAFAKSLLLGDTSDLSYAEETALRISGIRHIVAVSRAAMWQFFSDFYGCFAPGGRGRLSCWVCRCWCSLGLWWAIRLPWFGPA